jgi:membrane dipeptidase
MWGTTERNLLAFPEDSPTFALPSHVGHASDQHQSFAEQIPMTSLKFRHRTSIPVVQILAPLIVVTLVFMLQGCSSLSTTQRQPRTGSEEELRALAKGIHERALTMDTHADISPNFASEKDDVSSPENKRQVTLPKMRKGGLDAEFFAVFTPVGVRTDSAYENAYRNAHNLFDAIHRLPAKYPDQIDIAYTAGDVVRIHKSGKLVACIGVENGYPIGTDLGRLKEFYDKGARYITLTHTDHNQICDSSTPRDDEAKELYGGLSPFGEQVVLEMNRLGIMVDVSHTSKKATLAALALSKAPVIASHSGADAVNKNPRNVDDETLQAIKARGGVVQVVGLAEYIKTRQDSPERVAALDALRKEYGLLEGRGAAARQAMQALTQEQRAKYREKMAEVNTKFPRPQVTVQDMVDHIDHIVKVIGVDYVGIGSDFDGGGGLTGWNGADDAFNITLELVKRGYTEDDIRKIWGENLLRVWREVEHVAKELQAAEKH